MYRTDDPIADFNRYDAELESVRMLLPVCSECDEHIMDDFCYEINDMIICEECMNSNYRKMTIDLMG